jgi:hypothetical protein
VSHNQYQVHGKIQTAGHSGRQKRRQCNAADFCLASACQAWRRLALVHNGPEMDFRKKMFFFSLGSGKRDNFASSVSSGPDVEIPLCIFFCDEVQIMLEQHVLS